MSATFRCLLLAAVFVLLPGLAIAQPLPPSPVPVPPAPPPGPPPVPPPSAPLQQPLPPAQPYVPAAPSTGLADPGPNGWAIYGPPSGVPTYFFDAELAILKPVFKDHIQGTVTLPDGTTNTLGVPRTDLPWTVSPRLELGYKLPDSLGEFLIGYQFLVSNGSQTLATDAGTVDARTRLNMNLLDLDYNSAWYSPGPRWEMKWTVGARIAWVYYDTQISNDILAENASNYFYGAGGHAAFELERATRRAARAGLLREGRRFGPAGHDHAALQREQLRRQWRLPERGQHSAQDTVRRGVEPPDRSQLHANRLSALHARLRIRTVVLAGSRWRFQRRTRHTRYLPAQPLRFLIARFSISREGSWRRSPGFRYEHAEAHFHPGLSLSPRQNCCCIASPFRLYPRPSSGKKAVWGLRCAVLLACRSGGTMQANPLLNHILDDDALDTPARR